MMKSPTRRSVLLLAAALLLTATMGGRCVLLPGFLLPPPIVTVELANLAGGPVDPGLFVDGFPVLVSPALAPGETVFLDVDCFRGTTLQTDATLLIFPFAVPSENVPLVEEGFEFFCGDLVSFLFIEDAFGFFTNVEVNGFLLP